MKSAGLIRELKKNRLRVFTTRSAAALTDSNPDAACQLLRRLAKEKLIVHLKRGVWANLLAPSLRLEEAIPYLTAPWSSYVSLYSALSENGLIAEIPSTVYAVSSGRSLRLKTPLGDVSVHHIPPTAIWGFEMRSSGDGGFPLATPEKAYLDTLYLASIPRSLIRRPSFRHPPRFDKKRLIHYLKKWNLKKLVPASLLTFLILFASLPLPAAEKFSRTQVMMGDVEVSIQVVAPAKKKVRAFEAMEKAFHEARRIEREVSEWQSESETSKVNRMAGRRPVAVGHDLMTILQTAQWASEKTGGAFDVTFASREPTTSYRDIVLDPHKGTAFLPKRGMKIGVSGIAKGYIVDQMARILRKGGFKNFIINAGDLYAAGRDVGGPWKIDVRFPPAGAVRERPLRESICQIILRSQAASTSGTYERGPHIVDPKTRRAAETDLASATVIAPTSMQADALATGIFVLGRERGGQALKKIQRGGGVLVDQGGGVLTVGDFPSTCGARDF